MSLPVVTTLVGATDRMLVPLEVVKATLGIDDASRDADLTALILAVGQFAAGPDGAGRELWRQTYAERTSGTGGPDLRSSVWPVEDLEHAEAGGQELDVAAVAILGTDRSTLSRTSGAWPLPRGDDPSYRTGTGNSLQVSLRYVAGYLMPGQVSTWTADTEYAAGAWVRSTDPTDLRRYLCTETGESGETEPTWPAEAGGMVLDGTATWQARDARELPEDVQQAALAQVLDWFRGGMSAPSNVARESYEGMSIEWRHDQGSTVTAAFSAVLRRLR